MNRLAQETSPYLLQHADNPVDWYPWGEEALQAAREQNKPILLSIGYSACHWCHVMAHESFEDEATARLMNDLFINIKVDREERPDLDHIYQTAHQLLSERSGGWPLTVFLSPDGVPFLAGTYFPKTQRYGLPSFQDLLGYVAQVWDTQQDEIRGLNQRLLAAMQRTLPVAAAPQALQAAPIEAACSALDASFDSRHGGFGAAPKFPHPTDLWLLLRSHARTGSPRHKSMVLSTLKRMAEGGIFDQLGGGFYRYSVDAEWNIPHFEKMLYDNGLLLKLYAEAFALSGDAQFKQVVEDTAGWLLREMRAPGGGFYSALDADSEGEEGRFYVWSAHEVKAALGAEDYAVAARYLGLNRGANFEATHWHFYLAEPLWQVASHLKISNEECAARWARARTTLLGLRENRPRPGRDDKILLSWNALAIEGLARAGGALGQRQWVEAARGALEFIREHLWQQGRLLGGAAGQEAKGAAFLDDYAFLLSALLEMLRVDFRADDLAWAQALADALLARFEDTTDGGFFFTPHDHETLIHRPKPGLDHALPAGNAVAAFALQRLGQLTGEPRYLAAAERSLQLFYPALAEQPGGYSMMAVALMDHLQPPRTVVLRGEKAEIAPWCDALNARFMPDVMNLAVAQQRLPRWPVLDKAISPSPAAWVCQGTQCLPPIEAWSALEAALSA